MEREPLISVIMPAYNASGFISEAIGSVLAQTYGNWELLVIDDASADATYSLAEQFVKQDSRVKLYRNTENSGVSATRNRGTELARGAYIALLDSDDTWEPDKLEKQMKRIEETGAGICYSAYDYIDESGARIHEAAYVPETTDFERMLRRNEIGCLTAVAEASAMKAHPFRTDVQHEDYALWLELLESGVKAAGLTEVLAHYRQTEGARNRSKLRAARERFRIYREVLGLSFFKSVRVFAAYALDGLKRYH